MTKQGKSIRYEINGARRLSNYVWGSLMCLGGAGFLLTGLSSYFNFQLFPYASASATSVPILKLSTIQFFPQGLVMCFYGTLGFFLGLYIWFTIYLNLGQGFNEFNIEKGVVRIFRWGFPGKNRRIDLQYPIQEIQSIRLDIQEGLNPKRVIYLRLIGNREIPLTRAGQPVSIQEIEKQAVELAKLLQVSLEGM